jgi:hypothetical protein
MDDTVVIWPLRLEVRPIELLSRVRQFGHISLLYDAKVLQTTSRYSVESGALVSVNVPASKSVSV